MIAKTNLENQQSNNNNVLKDMNNIIAKNGPVGGIEDEHKVDLWA